MVRALVTGCAGFIGSLLVERLLRAGQDVIGIDRFTDYYPPYLKERNLAQALKDPNFKLVKADILDIDEFPAVDWVFHLAGQPGVRASWGKDFQYYVHDNVEATQKLLEAYKSAHITKLVYSSSSSVYGDAPLPMSEDSVPLPISPYGVTKLAAEHLCYLYCRNYSVPTISLRYFTVYGPRQRPDMAIHKFTQSILKKERISIYGDGTQTRDFTFVDDVVEANMLAAESDMTWGCFNIGGGSRISVEQLISLLENLLDQEANVQYVEKQRGDVQDTLADTQKTQNLLRWQPRSQIEEGLQKYVDWISTL